VEETPLPPVCPQSEKRDWHELKYLLAALTNNIKVMPSAKAKHLLSGVFRKTAEWK